MFTQIFKAARIEGKTPIPYVAHCVNSGLIAAAGRLHTLSKRAGLAEDQNLATRFLDARFDEVNFQDRFLQSAWSTLTSKIDPIITKTVIRSVGGSDFSPSELMCGKRPVTIYLRWPELHLLALTPLIRLVWSSLIDELTEAYDSRKEKTAVLCSCSLMKLLEHRYRRYLNTLQLLPAGGFCFGLRFNRFLTSMQSMGQNALRR